MPRLLTADDVALAADILLGGGLVAFPTETVYGLGADARSAAAVARVFAAKGRPSDHPLIVHLAAADQLDEWAGEVAQVARDLAGRFWPGPLTLVVPRAAGVPDAVTGGRDSVGLRVPAHPLALRLLEAFGGGVAAPSANRFGRVSPTTAAHVVADLATQVDAVLDGGPCAVGVESTIVEVTVAGVAILRPGGIAVEAVEEVVGGPVDRTPGGPARAPGMLASHYAPSARVVLAEALDDAVVTAEEEAASGWRVGLLAPSAPAEAPGGGVLVLAAAGDAVGYARSLYARLREADDLGLDVLVAVPPPPDGVGTAVRDRLVRAAAGR